MPLKALYKCCSEGVVNQLYIAFIVKVIYEKNVYTQG